MIENNKLFAEFLGRKGRINKLLYCFKNLDYNGQVWFNDSELRFHKDWNWLMEIIEKIKSLGFKVNTFNGEDNSYVSITNLENLVFIGSNGKDYNTENNSFEAVYKACLEFIKWYNEQNK